MANIANVVDTWESSDTNYRGIDVNVTDTASGSDSRLISARRNGSEKFAVDRDGRVQGRDMATDGSKLDLLSVSLQAAPDLTALQADTDLTYTADTVSTVAAGDYITLQGGKVYEVAASGASDHHYTTAGGVKLYEAGSIYTTRARLAQAKARGIAWAAGDRVTAGDLEFAGDPSNTAIDDLNGLRPVDPEPDHWDTSGGTDYKIAVADWMAYGGQLKLPGRTFTVAMTAGNRVRLAAGATRIVGEPGSKLVFDETVVDAVDTIWIRGPAEGAVTDFIVENVTFEGTAFGIEDFEERGKCIDISATGRCLFTNCQFRNIAATACEVADSGYAVFDTCEFYMIREGGARHVNVSTSKFINCNFQYTGDDAIASTWRDTDSNTDRAAIIAGCTFQDCMGARILGARNVILTDLVMRRVTRIGVQVGMSGSTSEVGSPNTTVGNNNAWQARISNVVITDIIDTDLTKEDLQSSADGARGISITGDGPGTVNGHYVRYWDSDEGEIVLPEQYFYSNDVDDTGTKAGIEGVSFSGFSIKQTLYPTTNYSDYGFGDLFSKTGWRDPEVTAANFANIIPVSINCPTWNTQISNFNIDFECDYAIEVIGVTTDDYNSLTNLQIANGNISGFRTAGVRFLGHGDPVVRGVIFDGDPYFNHPDRGSGGTWTDATNHGAIRTTNCRPIVQNCHFKNMAAVLFGNASFVLIRGMGNLLHCDPVAIGNDEDNKGIRSIGQPTHIGNVVIVECDPTTAAQGRLKNHCPDVQAAKPTAGKYVEGIFVRNSAMERVGLSSYLLGWQRLTTGTAHVDQTDWAIVYGSGTLV